jgi:hypothetical protein
MMTLNVHINSIVDELLNILDADAAQIKLTLERLNRLRGAVIKRDEEDIKALLDTVREDETGYNLVETRRHEICKELAGIFGCSGEQINMTRLRSELSEEKALMVAEKQHELRNLVEKLRIEHTCTTMLLKECARLNKILLRSIMGEKKETVTYNERGNAAWEASKGIVSLRL